MDDPDADGEDNIELDAFLPRRPDGHGHLDDDEDDDDGPKSATLPGTEGLDPDDPLVLVKRAVPERDDPTLPALTFRAVLIGSLFAILGAGVAQLFFYKSNSPGFSAYFVILVSLPMGRWLARTLPDRTITVPFIGGVELNPGDFSIK